VSQKITVQLPLYCGCHRKTSVGTTLLLTFFFTNSRVLLRADYMTILCTKICWYWTKLVGVILKCRPIRGPFLRHSVEGNCECPKEGYYKWWQQLLQNDENRNVHITDTCAALQHFICLEVWITSRTRVPSTTAVSKLSITAVCHVPVMFGVPSLLRLLASQPAQQRCDSAVCIDP